MLKKAGPFGGRLPRLSDSNLPENYATVATNCDVETGDLYPILDVEYISDIAGGKIIDSTGAYVVKEIATGPIASFADYSGTVAGTVLATDVGHGRTTGDELDFDTVSGDFEGIYSITKVDNDTFYFTFTWADAAGTTTGTWKEFKYVISGQKGYSYNLAGSWLSWATIVHVVKSFLSGTNDRIYFTGDGAPKQTNLALATAGITSTWPTTSYSLGVPAPLAALTVALAGSGTTTAIQDVSYVYTYVTGWGEESAPSPASANITVPIGDSVTLGNFVDAASASYNVVSVRVYKLNAGNTLADFDLIPELTVNASLVVGDIPVDDAVTYGANDDVDLEDTTDVIVTEDFLPPPSDLEHLLTYTNGTLAGVSASYLYLSEPFYPYAWPIKYRKSFSGNFVALGHHQESVFILTDSKPWYTSGYHPSSTTIKPLSREWPCKSAQGVVSTEIGVIFPSSDGMAILSNSENKVISKTLFTKDQWKDLDLENMMLFYHADRVYVLIKNTTSGFWFDPRNPDKIIDFTLSNGKLFIGGQVVGGIFYVLLNNLSAYAMYEWEGAATYLAYTWWSKEFQLYELDNFGHGLVIAESYADLTFYLEVDGVVKHTETVANSNLFTMPGGYLGEVVRIGLSGTDVVDLMAVSTSVEELIGGAR